MPETAGKRFIRNAAYAATFFVLGIAVALLIIQFRNGPALPAGDIAAASPSIQEPAQGEVSGVHCKVNYEGVDAKWAPAYADIVDSVYQGYVDTFGYNLPDPLAISITVTGEPTRLWTDGKSAVFLQLQREDDLLPTSRYKNVYGMCHEPGHIFMYSGLSTLAGLPSGVGEGWAHYCGSVICDYVWAKLGEGAYPIPFDYSTTGTARLEEQCKEKDKGETNTAACAFYELGKKYGHNAVGRAMMKALESKPSGAQVMPQFRDAFAQITGAPADGLLPEAMLASALKWDSKQLEQGKLPEPALFAGLKVGKGGWLHYDDDTNEGIRSVAGSGHAVIFRKAGGGKLISVKMKGARYGAESSKSVFRITILDGGFKEIRRLEFPFMKYEQRSENPYWVELPVPGVKVPEAFFVTFDFSPTATDGVYVAYDESTKGHSFLALPGDHLGDFDKGDWMIQAQVK